MTLSRVMRVAGELDARDVELLALVDVDVEVDEASWRRRSAGVGVPTKLM